ncbi:MAG: Stp1/IreP family PP2C-type Ser/Thr phosphatase [Ilumatobacteraceae bacterium]
MIRAQWGACTDVGRLRDGNEDSFIAVDGLFFVADGMGGHSAGEVASEIAVKTLEAEYTATPAGLPDEDRVADAVSAANRAIFREAIEDPTKAGMGTTLTGLVVSDRSAHRIVVANVGDSRTYLWRHDELRQVTKDHSHVQSLVDRGAITRAEARVHVRRNIVLRAMGIEPYVDVDTFPMEVEDGDRFIMCSDGLVDEAADDEIENEIRRATGVQDLADRLVDLANRNGGRDNITVVVVDFAVVDEPVVIDDPVVNNEPDPNVTAADDPVVVAEPLVTPRPSPWFAVGAWSMFALSAAIAITVVVSALLS